MINQRSCCSSVTNSVILTLYSLLAVVAAVCAVLVMKYAFGFEKEKEEDSHNHLSDKELYWTLLVVVLNTIAVAILTELTGSVVNFIV